MEIKYAYTHKVEYIREILVLFLLGRCFTLSLSLSLYTKGELEKFYEITFGTIFE
jgi:hypothetical protein